MQRLGSRRLNAQILEEASAWFVELGENDVSAPARAEFTAWLRASPEHVRAFLQVSAIWEDAPLLAGRKSPDPEALYAEALSQANVAPLDTAIGRPASKPRDPGRSVRRLVQLAAAAGILAMVIAGGLWAQWHRGVYSTGKHQTRWVYLADGTTIELDRGSRIRVRLTQGERVVDLLRGQALFEVTRNPARPFLVNSGSAQVIDIGTEFNVERRPADTVVTVIEGRVATRTARDFEIADRPALPAAAGTSGLGTVIAAGEQVDLTPGAPPRPIHADVAKATAWARQTFVFSSAPLSEVVAQYNLYHAKRLVIQDPALVGYQVSGVFSTTDSTALVAFLRAQPALDVRAMNDEIDISSR